MHTPSVKSRDMAPEPDPLWPVAGRHTNKYLNIHEVWLNNELKIQPNLLGQKHLMSSMFFPIRVALQIQGIIFCRFTTSVIWLLG